MTAIVSLRSINKRYGNGVIAVDDISLDVMQGEFLTLLGPSGCGKTTTLRMIAGLEQASAGRIMIDGKDVTQTPPYSRDTGMVFQDYALFPHMTVLENVAFGLKMRGVDLKTRQRKASEMLAFVQLPHVADRKPAQLSGGQRQRVALARALVVQPAVLLLDEPLGALDAELRRQLQTELKRVQREVGITFIYVTHDQEEALTMSDRVVVMNKGKIEQVTTPQQLYERPASAFVARFIGRCNFRTAIVEEIHDRQVILVDPILGQIMGTAHAGQAFKIGQQAIVAVRPERMQLTTPNETTGLVKEVIYLGGVSYVVVQVGDAELTVQTDSRQQVPIGTPTQVAWAVDDAVVLPA